MNELTSTVMESVDLRREGKREQADAALSASLRRFAPRLPGRLRDGLLDEIGRISTPSDRRKVSVDLGQQLTEAGFKSMDQGTWLVLCNVLIQHWLFEASGVARDNARKAALLFATTAQGRRNQLAIFHALQASLDLGDLPLACHFRSQLGSAAGVPQEVDSYIRMCSGEDCSGLADARQDKMSKSFRDLIRGRSVAAVGPAPCDGPVGEEIDAFDVVVRFTYWGPDNLPPSADFGTRTDVSYYNVSLGRRIVRDKHEPHLTDLRCLVFKEQGFVLRGLPCRSAHWPHTVFFTGHPNMIPVCVFDLLHFDPARVKMFGTSFFLSKTSHHDNYVSRPATRNTNPSLLADHDLCSQVNFVRHLYKAGLVEAGGVCAEVLEMDEMEYLRGMEGVYDAS